MYSTKLLTILFFSSIYNIQLVAHIKDMSIFKWFKKKNEDPLASILSEEKEIENVKKK